MRTQPEGGRLQSRKRGLPRTQPRRHPDLGLPGSGTVCHQCVGWVSRSKAAQAETWWARGNWPPGQHGGSYLIDWEAWAVFCDHGEQRQPEQGPAEGCGLSAGGIDTDQEPGQSSLPRWRLRITLSVTTSPRLLPFMESGRSENTCRGRAGRAGLQLRPL